MKKTLLKRLLFEIFEDITRLEGQVIALESGGSSRLKPLLKTLKAEIAQQKKSLLTEASGFSSWFKDDVPTDAQAEKTLRQTYPKWRKQITQWTRTLYRLKKVQLLPETELFLNSLHLDKLLPGAPELTVLPAQDEEDSALEVAAPDLVVAYLTTLSQENPLSWVGLCDNFFRSFAQKTLQLTDVLDELNLPEPKLDVITPLLALRFMGPGYYPYYVLKSFFKADAVALWGVEPLLFQALNRFGLVNKDMVILHQSAERGRQTLGLEEPKAITSVLNEDVGETLLKTIEKVVPERLAFTEKSFMRSQLLEDRLEHGTLISAVPPLSSIGQLREDLERLENDDAPIYPVLSQLQEHPATPREIINAGWLYKLDHTLAWLTEAYEADTPEAAWSVVQANIEQLDIILLKSIEISEVHRVLAQEEPEQLVTV